MIDKNFLVRYDKARMMRRYVMSSFKDLRVVDNFYQTSLFFPMPTVIINDKRAKEKNKKY